MASLLEYRVDKVEDRLDDAEKSIKQINTDLIRLSVRVTLFSAIGACVGGAIVAGLVSYFLGGN